MTNDIYSDYSTCTDGGKVKCGEATMCRGKCSIMASGYITTFDSNVLKVDTSAMECKFRLMNVNMHFFLDILMHSILHMMSV